MVSFVLPIGPLMLALFNTLSTGLFSLPPAYWPFEVAVDLLGAASLFTVELTAHCLGHRGLVLRDHNFRFILLITNATWSIGAVTRIAPPPRLTTISLGLAEIYRAQLAKLNAKGNQNRALKILPSHYPTAAKAFEENG